MPDAGVLLKGRVFVSTVALKTLWKLEDTGHEITRTGKMVMVNGTFDGKQSKHLAAIKPQLARIVNYVLDEEYARA